VERLNKIGLFLCGKTVGASAVASAGLVGSLKRPLLAASSRSYRHEKTKEAFSESFWEVEEFDFGPRFIL